MNHEKGRHTAQREAALWDRSDPGYQRFRAR